MSAFPLPVQFIEGCAVVDLPWEIDYSNAELVRRTLLAVLNQRPAGVVADMTGTSFSDVAGMRAVLSAHGRAEELGCWMRVVIPHPGVRKVFALAGAESLVRIYASLNLALPHGKAPTQANRPLAIAKLVPRQPSYPELVALRDADEPASSPGEPPVQAAMSVTLRRTGSADALGALTDRPAGQPKPVHDLAPEERTPGLIAQVRSARDQSRAARSQANAVRARLAVTCADVAATHQSLAQQWPDNAARLLSISQEARDRAIAYRRRANTDARS